jgi:hypothetical protein
VCGFSARSGIFGQRRPIALIFSAE